MDMTPRLIQVDEPDEQRAGERASDSIFFGDRGRMEMYATHSRFGILEWLVVDHERLDELTELPAIVEQAPSLQEAIAGVRGIWDVKELNAYSRRGR